ncbi:MAG: phosphopantothenoylcysteine decarboxylase [Candidatus Moraniibacteriota bacterium]
MKVLVTAGSTLMSIDQVRAITNIFKGKTGTAIATFIAHTKADVTLVTSNPAIASKIDTMSVIPYKTYADLAEIMEQQIVHGAYDIIIHSAAVSDFFVSNVCVMDTDGQLVKIDATKKVSSAYPKLYLELSPTEKLINKIRSDWGYSGKLIKFKLEVEKTYDELISIAIASVRASGADLIVANCLEWCDRSAVIIYADGAYIEVDRHKLPEELWRRINR